MKKLILIPILCLPLLIGCASSPEKFPLPVATENRVVVDPKLLQPCETLPDLALGEITYEDIAQHYITVIGMYGTCAIKQDTSISIIRKLANLEK